MKIAICDDDYKNLHETFAVVKKVFGEDNTYILFGNGNEYEVSHDKDSISLLFLDIVMNEGKNGIAIKNEISKPTSNTFVIFTTDYTEYMPDAFGVNVLGFIQKPVTVEKIKEILDRTGWRIFYNKKIRIDINKYIVSDKIMYIISDKGYTDIYLENGEKYMSYLSLKKWIEELNELLFCRVNGSVIVAFFFVKKIAKNIEMKDGRIIRISKGKIKELKKKFSLYVENFLPLL